MSVASCTKEEIRAEMLRRAVVKTTVKCHLELDWQYEAIDRYKRRIQIKLLEDKYDYWDNYRRINQLFAYNQERLIQEKDLIEIPRELPTILSDELCP